MPVKWDCFTEGKDKVTLSVVVLLLNYTQQRLKIKVDSHIKLELQNRLLRSREDPLLA